jgi:hypothetical protein
MKKQDVKFHSDGYRPSRPAVNVKVHRGIEDVDFKQFHADADEGFTLAWVQEHVSDERLNDAFNWACERGFERLQEAAQAIFGSGVKVWAEGRSGGWAVVEGLPDFDSWDAIALTRWARFEQYAKAEADDVPYAMVDDLCFNVYVRAKDKATAHYIEEVSENI